MDTSYGQYLLQQYAAAMIAGEMVVNMRPEFLCGLELDIAFPALDVAFEFQGDQHFIPLHGGAALARQWSNDARKGEICLSRGIALVRVDAADLEYTKLTGKIRRACCKAGLRFHNLLRPFNLPVLRALNFKATAYRKTLKSNFGSPTAHKRGRLRTEAKRAAMNRGTDGA